MPQAPKATQATLADSLLRSMTWRCIGPPRGGRVVAVAGDPRRLAVFYFGAVAGGVWKTEDAGLTWRNVSDGFFKTSSVGALAVSESDPSILYAGMGETTIRTDVSHGDGVYKSTDGGHTWTHCGLADTRHIGKVRIHPHNPDLVYVAALGHAFGPNRERGVYRSKDGGKSWEQVLFKSERAGAVDLSFDPHSPATLYAAVWQTHRNFWELSSGGPDSGLWKSTDGGDTWQEITGSRGLPPGLKGKIGVAASPARAGRVWALVESSEKPGLYRSDDYGASWELTCDMPDLRFRPWYYMHLTPDPVEPDTLYVNNLDLWKSTDGGKSFAKIATPHGDNHDLWIDPADNQRMVQGNDGGANVSFNGGASWSSVYNQLTAQFYHVVVDNQFPYRVYGTQQDNSSISVPSDTVSNAISWSDSYAAGTGESGYIAVHPNDPNIVYVGAVGSSPGGTGSLQRYDHRTGQIRLVNVWPEVHGGRDPKELKYRFPWTFPILFSPHDAAVLYVAGNVVFKSEDEGQSWTPISPDLTRADPEKLLASGGPITKDTSGAEHYATISALRESPHEAGALWAGSDDGLVHLSRDGGKSWKEITPKELPEWSFVRTLEPSPHDAATCYLAATRYKLDDPAPYIYKTENWGKSWKKITAGLPADDFIRVVRADPGRAGLLYAGSETGLYVSFDDGKRWQRWEGSLPVTPVYDLAVKDTDLVAATHGRSFWILDDLTPLHQLRDKLAKQGGHLFAPRPAYRILPHLFAAWDSDEGKSYSVGLGTTTATFTAKKNDLGQVERTYLDAGQGAPRGALLYYWLESAPDADTPTSLAILDAAGEMLVEIKRKPAGYDGWDDKQKSLDTGPWMPAQAGVNRFLWDMRLPGAERVAGNKTAGEALAGPLLLPGSYQVRLAVGKQSWTQPLEVLADPRSPASADALAAQQELLLWIRDKVSDAHRAVNKLRRVREQATAWRGRVEQEPKLHAAADAFVKRLDAIEDALILPGEQKDTYGLNQKARLAAALATVIAVAGSADGAPTAGARGVAEEYAAQIDAQIAALEDALAEELPALNKQLREAEIDPIG